MKHINQQYPSTASQHLRGSETRPIMRGELADGIEFYLEVNAFGDAEETVAKYEGVLDRCGFDWEVISGLNPELQDGKLGIPHLLLWGRLDPPRGLGMEALATVANTALVEGYTVHCGSEVHRDEHLRLWNDWVQSHLDILRAQVAEAGLPALQVEQYNLRMGKYIAPYRVSAEHDSPVPDDFEGFRPEEIPVATFVPIDFEGVAGEYPAFDYEGIAVCEGEEGRICIEGLSSWQAREEQRQDRTGEGYRDWVGFLIEMTPERARELAAALLERAGE